MISGRKIESFSANSGKYLKIFLQLELKQNVTEINRTRPKEDQWLGSRPIDG